MNFLWDIVVRAQQQGKKEEDLFFCQAKEYSPFYEQSFSSLNENRIDSDEIELNLLFRMADIFQEIIHNEYKDMPQWKSYLVDAALHVLLHSDLRHGVTKREIYIRKLLEEMENGIFWGTLAEEFQFIPMDRRSRIATLIFNQMQTGSSLRNFRRGLLIMFPDAVLYQIKEDRRKLLLYLKDSPTEEVERRLQFVQDMFLPIGFDLRVFWKYHFGIVGIDDTMQIDEIAIY